MKYKFKSHHSFAGLLRRKLICLNPLRYLLLWGSLVVTCELGLPGVSHLALAEEATIPLPTPEEIASAVGYVISENSLASEIPAQVKSLPDGRSAVVFEIGNVDKANVYVSARVKTKAGRTFFTDITYVKSQESIARTLPTCSRNSKIPFVQSQLENLKSLTENRHTQRGLIKEKISRDLDNGEAKRILTIEKALGLNEHQPISVDMHPLELIKREFRLMAALKRWEDSKVIKDAPLPPPSAGDE